MASAQVLHSRKYAEFFKRGETGTCKRGRCMLCHVNLGTVKQWWRSLAWGSSKYADLGFRVRCTWATNAASLPWAITVCSSSSGTTPRTSNSTQAALDANSTVPTRRPSERYRVDSANSTWEELRRERERERER